MLKVRIRKRNKVIPRASAPPINEGHLNELDFEISLLEKH